MNAALTPRSVTPVGVCAYAGARAVPTTHAIAATRRQDPNHDRSRAARARCRGLMARGRAKDRGRWCKPRSPGRPGTKRFAAPGCGEELRARCVRALARDGAPAIAAFRHEAR